MELHYKSTRQGLSPMVIGLLHGLEKCFNINVDVTHIHSREQDNTHDIFSIKYTDSQSNDQ